MKPYRKVRGLTQPTQLTLGDPILFLRIHPMYMLDASVYWNRSILSL
jgi:hypothetical protein